MRLEWKKVQLKVDGEKDGKKIVVFDGEVEVPKYWDDSTIRTACIQYLRVVKGKRETSFKQVFGRVTKTLEKWAVDQKYFTEGDAKDFSDRLYKAIFFQRAAFNSPVWYNLGIKERPQVSACFILGIEDSMDEISDTQAVECRIYKGGSGAGVSYGNLRSSLEPLNAGGFSSGPIPFIRGTDSYAKAIKSGGAHRRAAKMSILPIDHPDIEDFINMKRREEAKAQILIAAGYDGGIDGEAYKSVGYQDMNVSVRLTDDFMKALKFKEPWELKGRLSKALVKKVEARHLMNIIIESIEACGDPGIQFQDTINKWNTLSNEGSIDASNPCGEFLSLAWTACNLASLNLLAYFNPKEGIDIELLMHDVDLITTAQEIMVSKASYPDQRIEKNSESYRQLGLGYANLGGLLSALMVSYDSDKGRSIAALITAIMTAQAYLTSAKIAEIKKASFGAWKKNQDCMMNVLRKHRGALDNILPSSLMGIENLYKKAVELWDQVVKQKSFRNSQVTLLAPTGTISFLMGCITTGIEPEICLSKTKIFVDGRVESSVSPIVQQLLTNFKYQQPIADQIIEDIKQTGGSDKIRESHKAFFFTSLGDKDGNNALSYEAHIKMMAAVQPFLSMGISKTVNMTSRATRDDIEKAILLSHELGLKGVAIYKDKSKFIQPLISGRIQKMAGSDRIKILVPETIPGILHKFRIGNFKARIQAGLDPITRRVVEVYTPGSKQGSTLSGWMDAWAITFSKALQAGCSLQELVEALRFLRFEPSGFTSNPDIPQATSIVDYIVRWLEMECSDEVADAVKGIYKEMEDKIDSAVSSIVYESEEEGETQQAEEIVDESAAPPCGICGEIMQRKGQNCYICTKCGSQEGVCG